MYDTKKDFKGLPDALVELMPLRLWICYKKEYDKTRGKWNKIPKSTRRNVTAGHTDNSARGDFKQAAEAMERYNYSGIGLSMETGIGLGFIDLDNCLDDAGNIKDDRAAAIVQRMDSYTEVSPSGRGLHILFRCSGMGYIKTKKTWMEMYTGGQYCTITGNIYGTEKPVAERGQEAQAIYDEYLRDDSNKGDNAVGTHTVDNSPNGATGDCVLSDEDVIKAAWAADDSYTFDRLWRGDWQEDKKHGWRGYGSQSDADMALCNRLAYWTGRNVSQIDRLFRQSGLMRDKWDEVHYNDGSTYGAGTIKKACGAKNKYKPQQEDSTETADAPKVYSFDDTGNADRFVDNVDTMRYSVDWGYWLQYDGRAWKRDSTREIYRKIDSMLPKMVLEYKYCLSTGEQEAAKEYRKWIGKSRSNNVKKALERELEHRLAVASDVFDKKTMLLNTQNGTLDLQYCELKPHNMNDFVTKTATANYDTGATCPQWLAFLDTVFDGDKDTIETVQRAVGYSLTGSTKEQCMFICIGKGRNGKSTFLEVLRDVLGDYALNIQPETLMVKKQNNGASNDIARLRGTRFVTTVETADGCRLNESLIKQLTGGDRMTARFLYGEYFEFDPEFKIWMATNSKPIIRGTDDGIWRRIRVIPFNVQIPEDKVDKDLKEKLLKESAGILVWMVEGLKMWLNDGGLKESPAIQAAVNDYRTEMDVLEMFIDDYAERDISAKTSSSDLYRAYKLWAMETGNYTMTNTKFGIEMSKKFERQRETRGFCYIGIKIKEPLSFT